MKESNRAQIGYGSTLIISGPVQFIEKNEDLEEFAKCCENVCKLWKEIDDKYKPI
jgi:hypothetical protein